ncbi:MAG: type II secretion system F family protein [Candidatus Woesearchaeota archaeon]
MTTHVPFLFISPDFVSKHLKPLRGIGKKIGRFFPTLPKNLKHADMDCSATDFIIAAILSAALISILFAILILVLAPAENALKMSLGYSFAVLFLFVVVITQYPSIIAKKIADQIDKHLMFAVKDLLLHTASGTSLYNAIVHVSQSDYGIVSKEFDAVARKIESGRTTDSALEELAETTESVYLKKVIWQIVNTLKSGSNLKEALSSIVNDLTMTQRADIMSYANELNLWSLIYMLFAVAAPTIGITMMIILSSFTDMGISPASLIMFFMVTLMIQIMIISLIKSRRPVVEF